ncbi:winged helix-turn-helix domain-containing protein [Actinomadura sp. NAK00032]|uniref:AfsR/SARP family transcriptional regulator n=1 Tax=Actinomadura sp. NAK00032 TaxID=2742128 RepID=UPI00158FD571|nr:BTAD domain-containing putative transcriptional regulator [Actinomadura sp. NAK00032]QKW37600.1 winged helix-turn-helix domain-containing protein [Actinomadura sp. NAK00032]
MPEAERSVRLELLGRMRVWRDETEVTPGPPKQRAVLGLLAGRVNEVVEIEEIIDAVWGDTVPATASNSVHTYIAGLRKVLEPRRGRRDTGEVLVSTGGGYSLCVPPENIDVERFMELLADARRSLAGGLPAAALREFDAALGLWRGEAYTSVPGPFAETERAHLFELRMTATEEWAGLMLEVGRHPELAAVLTASVAKHPLRERLRWLLMLALYRCGRQARALEVYRETRELLIQELGIEPGPDLRTLHEQILAGSPELLAPVAGGAPALGRPGPRDGGLGEFVALRPAQLPPKARGFTGRTAELGALRAIIDEGMAQPGNKPPLVVIDGVAGSGKTALALTVGHEFIDRFPDGQLFIDLGGFSPGRRPLDAAEALGSLLLSLGVSRRHVPAELEGRTALYRSLLHDRRVLIVLDDALEPEQLRPLVPGGPACVLITSRRRQSGFVARDGAHRVEVAPLELDESISLLTYLIGAERVDGQREDTVRIAEMCGHLPLALRLAAEQLTAHPRMRFAELVERYTPKNSRLDRLAVENDPEATLRSVFGASYRALDAEPARMFRLLGAYGAPVFCVSEAAALAGLPWGSARRVLENLADNHLLDAEGRDNYRFHTLIGTYAAECSRQEPERRRNEALRRVLRYQRARNGFFGGAESILDIDHPAARI